MNETENKKNEVNVERKENVLKRACKKTSTFVGKHKKAFITTTGVAAVGALSVGMYFFGYSKGMHVIVNEVNDILTKGAEDIAENVTDTLTEVVTELVEEQIKE